MSAADMQPMNRPPMPGQMGVPPMMQGQGGAPPMLPGQPGGLQVSVSFFL